MEPLGPRGLGLDGLECGEADQRALNQVERGGIVAALGHDPTFFGDKHDVEGAGLRHDMDVRGVAHLLGEAGKELRRRGGGFAGTALLPDDDDGEQKCDDRGCGQHHEIAAAGIGEKGVHRILPQAGASARARRRRRSHASTSAKPATRMGTSAMFRTARMLPSVSTSARRPR